MQIKKNSRQMPSHISITREKDYCDLLYAWLQCNSERVSTDDPQRRIAARLINFSAIERDFTRPTGDNGKQTEKVMNRRTIAKYFEHLQEQKLISEKQEDGYYYLTVLEREEANLIEYTTLSKLMNVLQRHSLTIYIYLFNRYCANGYEPFIATMRQIKEFIGIATTTSSNNLIITDTIEILERLGLLKMKRIRTEEQKVLMEFQWVTNELPNKISK